MLSSRCLSWCVSLSRLVTLASEHVSRTLLLDFIDDAEDGEVAAPLMAAQPRPRRKRRWYHRPQWYTAIGLCIIACVGIGFFFTEHGGDRGTERRGGESRVEYRERERAQERAESRERDGLPKGGGGDWRAKLKYARSLNGVALQRERIRQGSFLGRQEVNM